MAKAKRAPNREKRAATEAANRQPIDFSVSLSAHDLVAERSVRTSHWVQRLQELKEGVESGAGEFDRFYKIGEFSTPSGARTTLNSLRKRELPGLFEVETRVIGQAPKEGETDTRRSELWAAVVSPEAEQVAA